MERIVDWNNDGTVVEVWGLLCQDGRRFYIEVRHWYSAFLEGKGEKK